MKNNRLRKNLNESLSKTDENQIGVMIRKEIKKAFGDDLEKKVLDIIKKELKGKKLRNYIVDINKDVLIQVYKDLWIKRQFWLNSIK
jgi:citrate lyase gamma subunit